MRKLLIVLIAVFGWYQGIAQVSKLTTDTPKGIYTVKGDYYFDHNNYADAIKYYNESLNKDSNNVHVIIKVAESYLRSNYSEIAYQWYTKAFNLNPTIDEKFTTKYITKLINNNSYDELRQISENSFEDLTRPGEISIYNSNGEIIKLYDSNNENIKFDFIPGQDYKLIINYDNFRNEIKGSNKNETDLLKRNIYTFHIQKLVENILQQSGKSSKVEDIHINPGDLVTFQLIPNPSSYSDLNNSRIRYNQDEVNINNKDTLVFSYVAELSPNSTTNDSTLLSENFKKLYNDDLSMNNIISDTTSISEPTLAKNIQPDNEEEKNDISLSSDEKIASQEIDLSKNEEDSIQLATQNTVALLNGQTLEQAQQEEQSIDPSEEEETDKQEDIVLLPDTILTNTNIVETETEQPDLIDPLISAEEVAVQKEGLPDISLKEDSVNVFQQPDNELAIAQQQDDLLDESQTLIEKEPAIDSIQLSTPNTVALLNEQPNEQTLQEEEKKQNIDSSNIVDKEEEKELQDKQDVIELIPETSLTNTDIAKTEQINLTDSLTSTEEVVAQAEDLPDINLKEDSDNIIEQADNELAIDQQQDDLLDESKALVDKDQIIDANPTPNDLINSEDNIVQFRVQIAAARSEINDQQLKKIYSGSKTIFAFNEDGYYKYAINETPIYFDAKLALYESNVKNAFIAAYLGDTKLKLQDAIAMQNNKPNEQSQLGDENQNTIPITENEQTDEIGQSGNQKNIDSSSEKLLADEENVVDTDKPDTTNDTLINTEEIVAQVESVPEDKPSSEITTIPNDDKITMTQQQTELLDQNKTHVDKAPTIDSTQLSTPNAVALLNEQPSEQTLHEDIKEQNIEPSNVVNKEEENELIPETALTNTDIVDTETEQTNLTESLINTEEVAAQKEDLPDINLNEDSDNIIKQTDIELAVVQQQEDLLDENITLVEKDQIIDASPTPDDLLNSENNTVQFRVQIAAARSEISDTQLEKIYSGDKAIFTFNEEGYYKYAIEETPNYTDAKQALYESNVRNAFIAAYLGDTKLKLQDAIARQNKTHIEENHGDSEEQNITPNSINDQAEATSLNDNQENMDLAFDNLHTEEVTKDTVHLNTTDSSINTEKNTTQKEEILADQEAIATNNITPNEQIQLKDNDDQNITPITENDQTENIVQNNKLENIDSTSVASPDKNNLTKEIQIDSTTTFDKENNDFQYRIQIAAAKSEISSTHLRNMYSGSKAIFAYNEDGYYKYAIEETPSYYTAKQTLKESELEHAFIVAYKEEIKWNLKDAIALQYQVPKVVNELSKSDSVVKVVTVNFEIDEFITPTSERLSLQELIIDQMKTNKSYYAVVNGYTDIRGSGAYNFGLSQERALYVKQLILNEGISTERVTTQYFGESQLIKYCPEDENCDESIHQANRRVEVLLLISK